MKSVTILLTGRRRIVVTPGVGYECEARVGGVWCLSDADFPEVKEQRVASVIKALQNTSEFSLAA